MNPFPNFHRWDLVLMCVAMASVFALEMIGVFNPNFVTITAICRSFIPRWLRFLICLWLMWHFVGYQWLSNKSWPELLAGVFEKL